MTRREAKRLACEAVSGVIEGHISSGAEWLFEDREGGELSEADAAKVIGSAQELADELMKRGRP